MTSVAVVVVPPGLLSSTRRMPGTGRQHAVLWRNAVLRNGAAEGSYPLRPRSRARRKAAKLPPRTVPGLSHL